jgi:mannosyltransferase OCH1-like enzyme
MSKTLFTSYKCNIDDEIVQSVLIKWNQLNPSYNILYFSDQNVDIFFSNTEYYDTYKQMKNGVAISDFFRICYINKYSGYWFDFDLQPFKVDIPNEGNIHLFDTGFKNISYMFIGGKSQQKLFQDVIIQVNINILDNIKQKKNEILNITGPRIIQNLIFEKLNIKNIDGCFEGNEISKKYLSDYNYEFIYTKLNINNKKTLEYIELQNKYNKLPYQCYDYI